MSNNKLSNRFVVISYQCLYVGVGDLRAPTPNCKSTFVFVPFLTEHMSNIEEKVPMTDLIITYCRSQYLEIREE